MAAKCQIIIFESFKVLVLFIYNLLIWEQIELVLPNTIEMKRKEDMSRTFYYPPDVWLWSRIVYTHLHFYFGSFLRFYGSLGHSSDKIETHAYSIILLIFFLFFFFPPRTVSLCLRRETLATTFVFLNILKISLYGELVPSNVFYKLCYGKSLYLF